MNAPLELSVPVREHKKYKSVRSSACGKVILVGEHAVVYGAPAVALPLQASCLSLDFEQHDHRSHSGHQITMNERQLGPEISTMVDEALALIGAPAEQFLSIKGHSHLPMGAGLGSSASLCVAALQGLCALFEIKVGPEQIAIWANQLERRFHGQPSGLDTAVIAMQRPIFFVKGSPPQALTIGNGQKMTRPWRFVLIDSGERASTKTMIERAGPYFANRKKDQVIEDFGAIAKSTADALVSGDQATLATAMQRMQDRLVQMGVVTSKLQQLIDAAYEAGLSAVKVTGAGGGGNLLGLLPDDDYQSCLQLFEETMPGYFVRRFEI